VNILTLKRLDSAGSTESSSKVGAISEEEEKEESTAGSDVGVSEELFQLEENSTSMPYDFSFIKPEKEMEKGTYTFMEKQIRSPTEIRSRRIYFSNKDNDEEIIISGENEEVEGHSDTSIGGVQGNEVLQIVQNYGKNSRAYD
jgi:hypothetical protein